MTPPHPAPSRPHALGWILGVASVVAVVFLFPLGPCPLNCGEPDPLLLSYTKLPDVTPEAAARMIAWGQSFPCRLCNKRRRVTLLSYSRHVVQKLFEPRRQ